MGLAMATAKTQLAEAKYNLEMRGEDLRNKKKSKGIDEEMRLFAAMETAIITLLNREIKKLSSYESRRSNIDKREKSI